MSNSSKKLSMRDAIKAANKEIVSRWKESPDFEALLNETAAQESHYGLLAPNNPYQVDPIQRKEMMKAKYEPQLGFLGARWKGNDFNMADPETGAILAGMRYAVDKRTKKHNLSTPEGRAAAWKEVYNTSAGKGTVQQYLETNRRLNG